MMEATTLVCLFIMYMYIVSMLYTVLCMVMKYRPSDAKKSK